MRYVDLVATGRDETPDKIAVVAGTDRLSFAELDGRMGRLGGALRAAGLAARDRIALLALNELETVEIQAACVRSGFAEVPLNARLTAPELAFILGDVEPSLLIVGRGQEQLAKAAVAQLDKPLRVLHLGRDCGEDSYDAFRDASAPDPDADPDDPFLPVTILYTSGTTGRPKGAILDRLNLSARIAQGAIDLGIRAEDVWLQALPMFHIASIGTFAVLSRGGTSVQLETFTPQEFLRLLTEETCTSTVLVPTLIDMILAAPELTEVDMSAMRFVLYGGAPISPPLLRRALQAFGCDFEQWYGQTEGSAVTVLQPEDHDPADENALSSAGTAAYSWQVRIVDLDDQPVPDGEIGEVVGRGPMMMAGYWNHPEDTAETLRGGWLHTGDMGYRDERGFVHIVDRRNDMIITGGENVYPREVELAMMDCPAVCDIAVIGVPDERWGEAVAAIVVSDAEDTELDAWAREHLARYKVPRAWRRITELPRNVTGKVTKPILRKLLAESG